MNRYERLTALLEMLAARGRVGTDEAAAELGVSGATVRRDLDHLAEQQLLSRTHGGAVVQAVSYDLPMRYKNDRLADEKQRIGRAAANLAEPGSVVGLTGGTTATEVARGLVTRPELDLTVVTNALNIAGELVVRPRVKLVVTGGVARPQSYQLIGPLAARIADELSLDIAFIGVDGLDPHLGATARHEGEAELSRVFAAHAERVVVVAHSSKLGRRALARICGTDEVDVLVTDRGATDHAVAPYLERGVEVHRA
ncbi:DeoR/GlpR family DNA-binding transcription regulator [Umezawaea sp. Da 62-37]|uniref:DeoR/GlpR family DNA-binding transcription regulator n=1 Tax=Umezawaea sp. Da 62-37 TaxID=3075927 RepID=UPI0028F7283B|nr:DeoR/GlpR family DNA-binding transcription regulator [Umezawaea sp. Da 62-37]WNV91254.1 DeoR/GlpR family DNA-binding transcription regulator [Umezawaea sp. Da 62-37]